MATDSVVIASGARTAMGGFQGSLKALSAPELGAAAILAAIQRAGIDPEQVDDVLMGCVLPAGLKQGPARQAMRLAGLPDSTGAVTLNKLCGSGMRAAMFAHDQILAGSSDIVVAGGMESMTNAPYLLDKVRDGMRMGNGQIYDHMFLDGLEDAETGRLMGSFAQEVADKRGITRAEMDEFAIESLKRAQAAIENGWFKNEIVAVTVKTRAGNQVVDTDEQPGNARLEKIPTLRPAFSKDGTVTAANSSSISDGASALVLMQEDHAKRLGVRPLARIVAHSTNSQHPSEFTLAPCGAIRQILKKTGWQVSDVDLWEINEAFAMVAMIPLREFGIDHRKLNIHGGACALGHPVGSTRSRIVLTLIHALGRTGGRKGIASLCIGGGEATAMAIELC